MAAAGRMSSVLPPTTAVEVVEEALAGPKDGSEPVTYPRLCL